MSRQKASTIVQLADYREPPAKSQYELYRLPFFAAERLSTWAVKATGDYAQDCKTGNAYAVAFLESCDGSVGWSSLLGQIVADMIRAGPDGAFPDGHPKMNGIVVGFMGVIGRAVTMTAPFLLRENLVNALASDHL